MQLKKIHHPPLAPFSTFVRRVLYSLCFGFLIILGSLILGIIGYRYFGEMSWVSAYENAAMILSGMGPVDPMNTTAGKIFAGSYALFSGVIFLIVIAVIVAPIFHRFFHRFLLSDQVN